MNDQSHPILAALDELMRAWEPYCNHEEEVIAGFSVNDETTITATRTMLNALTDPDRDVPDEIAMPIIQLRFAIADLSGRYIFHLYTDSDTDSPCDIEYSVHELVARLVPGYTRPADIHPAYVAAVPFIPEYEEA